MRIVRILAFSTCIAITSCHSTQKATSVSTVTPQVQPLEMTVASAAISQQQTAATLQKENPVQNNDDAQPAMFGFTSSNNLEADKADNLAQPNAPREITSTDFNEMATSVENKQEANIQSFAQVKQMVANKQINLSKKQLKRLDKLDSKYHGDFKKFKDDAGGIFDTQTSKIIAAVGVVGLLLLIISGSGFGAFILILSVGALLLKWLHIISF